MEALVEAVTSSDSPRVMPSAAVQREVGDPQRSIDDRRLGRAAALGSEASDAGDGELR